MKIRLSPIIFLLLIQVNLKPRPKVSKKTSAIKKTIEEAIQLLESISLRL